MVVVLALWLCTGRHDKGNLIQPSGNALGKEDITMNHLRPEKGSLNEL